MAKNDNLHKAKDAKNDEFYTRIEDVAEELRHSTFILITIISEKKLL